MSASRASCLARSERLDQRMAHVEFKDRLGPRAAVVPRQQPLQFAVGTAAAGDQARRAVGESLRGAHVGYPIPERSLTVAMTVASSIAALLGLVRLGFRFGQRDQPEIHIALAQGFQRLAVPIER